MALSDDKATLAMKAKANPPFGNWEDVARTVGAVGESAKSHAAKGDAGIQA